MLGLICLLGSENLYSERILLRQLPGCLALSDRRVDVTSFPVRTAVYDVGSEYRSLGVGYDCIVFKNDFYGAFPPSGFLRQGGLVLVTEEAVGSIRRLKEKKIPYCLCGQSAGCDLVPSCIGEESMTVFLSAEISSP